MHSSSSSSLLPIATASPCRRHPTGYVCVLQVFLVMIKKLLLLLKWFSVPPPKAGWSLVLTYFLYQFDKGKRGARASTLGQSADNGDWQPNRGLWVIPP